MTTPTPDKWHETVDAKAWLAELDAAELMADTLKGLGWSAAAMGCGHRAADIAISLDNLRHEALAAFADATGKNKFSREWDEAADEADDEALSVEDAIKAARAAGAGRIWLERQGQ